MSQGKLEFAWKAAVGPAIGRATEVRLTAGERNDRSEGDRPRLAARVASFTGGDPGRLRELLGAEAVKAVKVVARTGSRG